MRFVHRRNVNLLLATVALLLGALSLDQYLLRAYPANSRTLTFMELQSGGSAAKEKVTLRRDHAAAVAALIADPADPLGMTPQERAAALQQLQLVESLLLQAMWSADRLASSWTAEERERVDAARRDQFLMNTALKTGPRGFEEQLAEAFRLPAPPPPARPPAGWDPDREPGFQERWHELRRGGEGFLGDSLLDLDAGVLVLAAALDQREHPVRGELAEERYALASALGEAQGNVDRHWERLTALLMVSGTGRGELLAAPPATRDGDMDLAELVRALREHCRSLEERP